MITNDAAEIALTAILTISGIILITWLDKKNIL